jgi:predicted lipoprotein with Yx(FWY)xxD motif
MKPAYALLIGLIAFSGCGSNDHNQPSSTETRAANVMRAGQGTRVILARSPYGRMLFDANRQAIYIFQRDRRNTTNCYGECARAWPPVYTNGRPRAGRGVSRSLLGSIRRRDGKRQVTYNGKPLYYYVNEGPGEVKCHNVNLNGGYWWAVGADGKRLQ